MPRLTLAYLSPAVLICAALLGSSTACTADLPPTPATSTTPLAPTLTTPSAGTTSKGKPPATESALPPPATTPVPPPTPGDVNETVPTSPERSKPAVDIDEPARTGTGVTVEIRRIRAIKAKAELPGEVAGPALALTVKVTNTGSDPVDLNSVVVTLTDSAEAPGVEMTAAPAKPLNGMLGPDQAREGVYVFALPRSKRDPVTVLVTVLGAPVLVFTGDAD